MPFTPTNFTNNQQPPLSAGQMNKLGAQYGQAMADIAAARGSGSGLATLDVDARLELAQLPTLADLREAIKLRVTPLDFGAVGDGVTVDRDAFQAAVTHVEENGGGGVEVPRGFNFNINGDVYLLRNTSVPVSIIGQGGTISGGNLVIGPAYNSTTGLFELPAVPPSTLPAPLPSGGIKAKGMVISGVNFDRGDPFGTKSCISLGAVRGLSIIQNVFTNCKAAVETYGDSKLGVSGYSSNGTAFHALSMLRFDDNDVENALFAILHTAKQWDYASDWDVVNNRINYAADTHFWIINDDDPANPVGGIDGFKALGNTHFHLGGSAITGPLWATKRYIYRIGQTDWLRIQGNNLFEAGLDAINLVDVRHFLITGNHFAWPGERLKASGVRIDKSPDACGIIDDNQFSRWSFAAISFYETDLLQVQIGAANSYDYEQVNPKYFGPNTLHELTIKGSPTGGTYRIFADNVSSAAIPYNADATAIAAAVNAIAGVTGATVSAVSSTVYRITYATEVAQRTTSALTGPAGTSPNVTSIPVLSNTATYNIFAASSCSSYPIIRGYEFTGVDNSIRGSAIQTRDPRGASSGIGTSKVTKAVTGTTSIFTLADTTNVSTRMGGEILIHVRRPGADTDIAHYKLGIALGSAPTLVWEIGKTTGATANDPSFSWSLSGQVLSATPRGSTASGTTWIFEAETLGMIMAR